jgi:Fe-S-cluster containining protein
MITLSDFNCDSCGKCCQFVGYVEDWGPKLRKSETDMSCKHLAEDNTCKIYHTRPDVCDIEKLYEQIHSKNMTWEHYKNLNYAACEYLKGLDYDK